MPFVKGQSGNPSGARKLPPEIIEAQRVILIEAVAILKDAFVSGRVREMSPRDQTKFMEIAFDRCGLPKIQVNENENSEVKPIIVKWQN